MSESKGVHPLWLALAVLLFAIAMFGGYLDQQHYFYHVHAARVTSAPGVAVR